mmetsp:Transcript_6625/g.18072  ORF Transcript_6625/g.18072 Transcript_6625/m.18072 type:complete len:751 (-) Transcript_6625:84-2336(-)
MPWPATLLAMLAGCALCAGAAEDSNPLCMDWALEGGCEENPTYMLEACPQSCANVQETLGLAAAASAAGTAALGDAGVPSTGEPHTPDLAASCAAATEAQLARAANEAAERVRAELAQEPRTSDPEALRAEAVDAQLAQAVAEAAEQVRAELTQAHEKQLGEQQAQLGSQHHAALARAAAEAEAREQELQDAVEAALARAAAAEAALASAGGVGPMRHAGPSRVGPEAAEETETAPDPAARAVVPATGEPLPEPAGVMATDASACVPSAGAAEASPLANDTELREAHRRELEEERARAEGACEVSLREAGDAAEAREERLRSALAAAEAREAALRREAGAAAARTEALEAQLPSGLPNTTPVTEVPQSDADMLAGDVKQERNEQQEAAAGKAALGSPGESGPDPGRLLEALALVFVRSALLLRDAAALAAAAAGPGAAAAGQRFNVFVETLIVCATGSTPTASDACAFGPGLHAAAERWAAGARGHAARFAQRLDEAVPQGLRHHLEKCQDQLKSLRSQFNYLWRRPCDGSPWRAAACARTFDHIERLQRQLEPLRHRLKDLWRQLLDLWRRPCDGSHWRVAACARATAGLFELESRAEHACAALLKAQPEHEAWLPQPGAIGPTRAAGARIGDGAPHEGFAAALDTAPFRLFGQRAALAVWLLVFAYALLAFLYAVLRRGLCFALFLGRLLARVLLPFILGPARLLVGLLCCCCRCRCCCHGRSGGRGAAQEPRLQQPSAGRRGATRGL